MLNFQRTINKSIRTAFQSLYQVNINDMPIHLEHTPKNFEGDYTFVLFPYLKLVNMQLQDLGKSLGDYLLKNTQLIDRFELVKGFLNLTLKTEVWLAIFEQISKDKSFFNFERKNEKVMIEFSSPNTNKPLHLGHLRNICLGDSISRILDFYGYEAIKTCLVNDRGIHICKSIVAYLRFGKNEEPQEKGDKFVGNYYVKFDQIHKQETADILSKGLATTLEEAKKMSPILKEAEKTLEKWEARDPEIYAIWAKMNNWVYAGFDQTYNKINIHFDKIYKESETYRLGRKIVLKGLENGLFFQKPDQSIWIDLTKEGLDQKLLLRGNGTSVYITQDLGTADLKYEDFRMQKSLYVVGNEQDYHFKVLQAIVKKLECPYAQGLGHISYGMVDLPTGKMKSREGTVVDADDLIDEMLNTAQERTKELGKIKDFREVERKKLYHNIAIGALKYYLLKIEPKKKILFNPVESINFQGDTGVYLQYNYAKIWAIIERAKKEGIYASLSVSKNTQYLNLKQVEKQLLRLCITFQDTIGLAAQKYDPSVVANFAFELAKLYSRFYAESPIFTKDRATSIFRVQLSKLVGKLLKTSINLLGIKELSKI